jgi:hypothetical protein
MREVMTICIIMHNMVIEEERDDTVFDQGWEHQSENIATEPGPPVDLIDSRCST